MARTHVVMSEEVLASIDRVVGKRGRSRFIEDAAKEKLARDELIEALRDTAGILAEERYPQWRDRESIAAWVRESGWVRGAVSIYLLDTTVLIDHLRGSTRVTGFLASLLSQGHWLAMSCVTVAEIEAGVLSADRKATSRLLSRFGFLPTTREAAVRAGRYRTNSGVGAVRS